MKKLLVFLLIPALLLCAACSPDSAPTESGEESTQFPGIDVQIVGLNTEGSDVKLQVLWRNQTVYPVTYGEPYGIERLESGQWISCAKQTQTTFISIGYALKAFDKVHKTYTVSELFDVSVPGTYRFRSHCSVQTGKGAYQDCTVMAEFTVGKDLPDPETGTDHSHQVATQAQTVDDPVTGYCGNTQTTLYIGEKEYSFMYGHSVTLTDILINLRYDPNKVCRCSPEYTADTEFGTGYGINLTQGYARCEKGQADLTQDQIDTVAQIIEWAQTTNCQYPLN